MKKKQLEGLERKLIVLEDNRNRKREDANKLKRMKLELGYNGRQKLSDRDRWKH